MAGVLRPLLPAGHGFPGDPAACRPGLWTTREALLTWRSSSPVSRRGETDATSVAMFGEVMMRVMFRVFSALALSFLLVPTILADDPTKAADKSNKSEAESADASPSRMQPAANSAAEARLKSAPAKSVKKPPPAAKKSSGPGRSSEAPKMIPMPATTGGLGLFTVEIGETLPARGFSFSAYA